MSTATPPPGTRGLPSGVPSTSARRLGPIWLAMTLDAIAVLGFTLLGRSNHTEPLSLAGTWSTLWPFWTGLALAWLLLRAWREPLRPVRTGLPLALLCVGLGMIARTAVGDGTAIAFIAVATTTVTGLLVGWRAVATAWLNRPTPKQEPSS